MGLRRRGRTRTRGRGRILPAARISRTSFPPSRGNSTMRARGSQYPIVGVFPIVITVDHDDNRRALGAMHRPRALAGRSCTEDRGSVVTRGTGCG